MPSDRPTSEVSQSCWYCDGESDYHPTCDNPGCDNETHGRGEFGKSVFSYCPDCRKLRV